MNIDDLKSIVNQLGKSLVILGIVEAVPIFVALYYGEAIEAFLYPSVFLIVFGSIISLIVKKETETRHAMVAVFLIYVLSALFGAIPFMYHELLSPLNAVFEVVSGFTTTGLTVFLKVENLPKSVLFWRSFTAWVGGIGIVVLMLTVLDIPGTKTYRFYQAEARTEKLTPRVVSTMKLIWWIYLLYTLVGIFLLYIAGMSIFEAANHTMAGLSTAGFSTRNNNIADFHSIKIELVLIFVMLLGAINFHTHYKFLTGKRKEALANPELKFLIGVSILGTLIIFLRLSDIPKSMFQVVSALTTTGYSTMDVAPLDDFSKSLLSLLMVFGANADSTGGAVKSIRILITLAALYWYIVQAILPGRAIMTRRLNGTEISDEVITAAEFYTVIYLIVLSLSALALMFIGYRGVDSIFEVSSALGNVGLSVGITNPAAPALVRFILIIDMLLGRIEIIPFFIFLGAIFYRKR